MRLLDPDELAEIKHHYALDVAHGERDAAKSALIEHADALAARVARLEDGLSEALGIVEQRYPDSAALLRREYLPDADGAEHGG